MFHAPFYYTYILILLTLEFIIWCKVNFNFDDVVSFKIFSNALNWMFIVAINDDIAYIFLSFSHQWNSMAKCFRVIVPFPFHCFSCIKTMSLQISTQWKVNFCIYNFIAFLNLWFCLRSDFLCEDCVGSWILS